MTRTHQFHSSPRLVRCLFFVCSCLWLLSSSCEYHDRFLIQLQEGSSFPCVGIVRLAITLEKLQPDQDAPSFDSKSTGPGQSKLFWNIQTGKCQMPDGQGISLPSIPYGGDRKITIQGFDSTGKSVALGSSRTFRLEASGRDIETTIPLLLERGCTKFDAVNFRCEAGNQTQLSLNTLIVEFPLNGPVPIGTKKLLFQLVKDQQNPQDEPVRRISIESGEALPTFLILADIPASDSRSFTIHALDAGNVELKKWTGTYKLPSTSLPSNSTQSIQPIVVTK